MENLGAAMPTHIFIEHNKVVDVLSNEVLTCKTFEKTTFLIAPPRFVNGVVRADISGTVYLKNFNLCKNYVNGLPMAQDPTHPL